MQSVDAVAEPEPEQGQEEETILPGVIEEIAGVAPVPEQAPADAPDADRPGAAHLGAEVFEAVEGQRP